MPVELNQARPTGTPPGPRLCVLWILEPGFLTQEGEKGTKKQEAGSKKYRSYKSFFFFFFFICNVFP